MNFNKSLVNLMTADLLINKIVAIGFCKRQCEDTVERLQQLRNIYPELISPLFGEDCSGTGGIHFEGLTNNQIKAIIYADKGPGYDEEKVETINITIERFKQFANATKDFAVFINDNGNNALNI